jgi:hypothetical protein
MAQRGRIKKFGGLFGRKMEDTIKSLYTFIQRLRQEDC